MSVEIFNALHVLERERGIPMDFMLEKIKKSIVTACKNGYDGNEDAVIDVDEDEGRFEVKLLKEVVDEVVVNGREISLKDAREIDEHAEIGGKVAVRLDTKEFGRVAAQTARNIIRQGIKDGERSRLTQEFQSKRHQIVSALVERVDPKNGALTLRIGKAESILPKSEQIGNENVKEGDHVKVYVSDVREGDKGPRVMISRAAAEFVKKLFELEAPEIARGEVEIKSISREAGSRTKIAVFSNEKNVDPIGACIGAHGSRINAVVSELGGEKIDVTEYNEDPRRFVAGALSPAKVLKVEIVSEEERSCVASVPDDQLSLAIGNKGQNVRLAARLTGWRIDVKPESGFYGE